MNGPDHDVSDPSKITPHPKLDKAAAETAAGALMGKLSFNKLRGCVACHQGEDGKGGLSGPELTDAGARLQPDFIAAYTAGPQRFDQHIWMPTLTLKDQDIQRLTAYLSQLGRGGNP